jgi:hypothetical protein
MAADSGVVFVSHRAPWHSKNCASTDPEAVVCDRSLTANGRLPQPVAERQADRAALLASNDRMATLSTDLVALVTLLRQAKVEQARPYRDRLEAADAEIRRHLDRASALIDRL